MPTWRPRTDASREGASAAPARPPARALRALRWIWGVLCWAPGLHRRLGPRAAGLALVGLALASSARGQAPPPIHWDLENRSGVAWSAPLGTETYGSPVLVNDLVLVGTNNARPREVDIEGDRAVLLALRLDDGSLAWQRTHRKLEVGESQDWPEVGLTSTPHFDGELLFYLSNRGEVTAIDAEGRERWAYDLRGELGVVPRHMSSSTPCTLGGRVFLVTSNGRAEDGVLEAPDAPSFVALDRDQGELLWQSALPGEELVEGQWSSPTCLEDEVLFPGGDGVVYSLEPATGDLLWRFDGNLDEEGRRIERLDRRHSFVASAVATRDTVLLAVGRDPEGPSASGVLWAIERPSSKEARSGSAKWAFRDPFLGRSLSTVARQDGVVYLSELNGFVFAVDEESGEKLWEYDMLAAIWTSPRIFGDALYVGDTEGDVVVLRPGRELEVLAENRLDAPIHTTPVALDGTLYWASSLTLWAFARDGRQDSSSSGLAQDAREE